MTPGAAIFLGKYSVAFLLAMVTTVLGLIGTLFSLNELNVGGTGAVSLPLIFYPEVIAIVALAALSMCPLGFCISTFAKNTREAQQCLSPCSSSSSCRSTSPSPSPRASSPSTPRYR